MGDRVRLPVLPLRETVVFPGVAVPISAGRPGTVAVWDNFQTQHYAVNDYFGQRRLMYRTIVKGTAPF